MYPDLHIELMSDFPDSKERIRELLQADEIFKEIAEDYLYCKTEIEKLSLKKSGDLTIKYSETLEDLKEELLSRLKENEINNY